MSDISITQELKALRNRAGLTVRETAERMGVPPSTYAAKEDPKKFKRESYPPKFVEKLMDVFAPRGISHEEIYQLTRPIFGFQPGMSNVIHKGFMESEEPFDPSSAPVHSLPKNLELHEVPVIDMVQAGAFTEAVNPYPKGYGSETIHVPYRHNHIFAVTVKGHSMDLEFKEGTKVVVDYTDKDLTDRKFYVILFDGGTTLKQYRAHPDRFEPRSTYNHYDTIFPEGEIEVVGRVIQAIQTY